MAILNYYKSSVYQTGTTGYPIFAVTDDSFNTITSAGWLNQAVNKGLVVAPNDFIFVSYPGIEQAQFTPSIDSNGIITLIAADSADIIVPPVTNGHFSLFTSSGKISDQNKIPSDATMQNVVMQAFPSVFGNFALYHDINGTITDNAKTPSDPAQNKVVMQKNPSPIGHIPVYADVNGTITDGGALGQAAFKSVSDNTKSSVASISGSPGIGAIATFSDIEGTITYDTANFRAQKSATFGGGGTTFTITDANVATSDVIQATLQSSTNTVALKATPQTGSVLITFASDPGAGTIIAYTVCQPQ